MDKFMEKLEEILDTEKELTPQTRLSEIEEWDSLSIISFLAMANVEYGKSLRKADFAGAETLQDLYDTIMRR